MPAPNRARSCSAPTPACGGVRWLPYAWGVLTSCDDGCWSQNRSPGEGRHDVRADERSREARGAAPPLPGRRSEHEVALRAVAGQAAARCRIRLFQIIGPGFTRPAGACPSFAAGRAVWVSAPRGSGGRRLLN